ncbi:hypothetical protein [Actinoallomurus rhizosphaericola]|uniref:hypothetical protein n=1 Tax=Actinoallomurus rhizosphaericola TaxID=2952536 RepID=UPI002092BD4A|nr:hypothetical protein [Actinoallomurus rhizosphaericola]MCO5996239.1 hypothetical protein [Actinoallomurus rhizosphaericola]
MSDESDSGSVAAAALLDDGLVRRLKALACTGPLHDLDTRKTRLDFADASVYAMAEIAFQIIDQVTITMDFDRGANHDAVIARVLPFIAAQAPDRAPQEHEKVARWVLENLINVGSVDRGFRVFYGTFAADGAYQRLAFDFKLLTELADADGEVYLRASDEAINVLIGALDTDVESAQIAAEIKLGNLIERGKLSDAQAAAQQARYATVQYAERLRRKLEATRRDVRSVDWEEEIPELIDAALTHVTARYRAETAILANIRRARDEATEPERKRRAAILVDIVADCVKRHTQLQARLIEANAIFRAEQDRQQFSGPPQRATVDLFGQLLGPTLQLSVADAAGPAGAFFQGGAGLATPTVVRLRDVVRMLIAPAAERDDLAGALPEPDLMPPPDPDVFSDEQWTRADDLLDLADTPRRLSALLAEARADDPALPHLLLLRVLHAVSPEIGVAVRQGDDRVLVAVDDGTRLEDPEFGGADLLVGLARVSDESQQGAVA